jgi:riboflavin-specific deaminase-like protein
MDSMIVTSLHGPSRSPLITVKFAQTLDGRIATRTGHSRWISGEESRVRAHGLRADHDAVLVGVGTILADDPQLTVRHGEGRDPLRVVVDSELRTPLAARVLTHDPTNTVLATTSRSLEARRAAIELTGAKLFLIEGEGDRVDFSNLFTALADQGIRSVLVEGGSQVLTSVLRGQLGHRLVAFIAPKIVGKGVETLTDLGIETMDQAIALEDLVVESAGQDIVISGTLVYPTEAH